MRVAAVAASLAGALALTACSGDGGSDAKDDSGPSAPASASADTGGGTGGSASGGLAGSWLATTDGKAVVLVVNGTEAALFSTGGTVCSGTAGEQDGMRMIRLKCPDGSKDRAVGMVDSVGRTRLKVTWQGEGGLGAETYQKAQGGKLPTGLPTAGLGS
ncbi:hypothetical protein [Streptomyces sp. SD31]|uniref:hypothetical protein n=1 Tax=Streptomyces sp. SD31 TaxID=3452208 RepID=UPI003F8BF7A3